MALAYDLDTDPCFAVARDPVTGRTYRVLGGGLLRAWRPGNARCDYPDRRLSGAEREVADRANAEMLARSVARSEAAELAGTSRRRRDDLDVS